MSRKPSLVLRVNDLRASVSFYEQALSWTPDSIEEEQGLLQMACSDGSSAILTCQPEMDVKPWMDVAFEEPKRGSRIYFPGQNLSQERDRLIGQGFHPELAVDAGVGQTLLMTDPDGYVVALWEELYLHDEGILDMYRSGPEMLEEALQGLSEEQLDLTRAPGKWSIRQTVLHLIDSDVTTAIRLKFALAEPGRTYATNPYVPDVWEKSTYYSRRPIQTEVQLFRFTRQHILNIAEVIANALDNTVQMPQGEDSVRHMLKLLAGHARGHIRQILETRQVHRI